VVKIGELPRFEGKVKRGHSRVLKLKRMKEVKPIGWNRRGDPIIGEGHWCTMRDAPVHPSIATTKGHWSENYAFDA
jgi:hypothetical protein